MTETAVAPQNISQGFHCFLVVIVPQAMKIPHWVDAMNQELEALVNYHIWM